MSRAGVVLRRLVPAAVVVACGGAAWADVPPGEPTPEEHGLRTALVFTTAYALTLLCEFLVLRASWAPHLVWKVPGRGRLLGATAQVNLLTQAALFGVLLWAGARDAPKVPSIVVGQAIPFLVEPFLFRWRFRSWTRSGVVEGAPSTPSIWGATLLANGTTVVLGATILLGVGVLFD